jgi:hypothetical protein
MIKVGPKVAAGAAAALLALGAGTLDWLEPTPDNKKLALYQAQCHTLQVAVFTQVAKEGYYFKALEALRTPAQAKWNAAKGIGISNSLHIQSLAWDFARVLPDGTVSFEPEDYKYVGEVWKEAGNRAKIRTRWGGDFVRNPDYVHFSCELNGIK